MKLSLAPIQSYTYVYYRYAHAVTFDSFDKYYTPFFEEDKNRGWKSALLPELNNELNKSINLIPQIATNNPEFLIRSATKFAEFGYQEINLNMGCPFPMLVKRSKGAGLLKKPDLLEEILNSFFKNIQGIKLSVKMRLGVDEPDEWRKTIPILNDFPISDMIVHPRTAKQKYGGDVNWDEFEKIAKECNHPVIGNGDINNIKDFVTLQNRFPHITSWMLGRGSLTNPFLSGTIKGKEYSEEERDKLFRKLHETYLKVIMQQFPVWNHAFNYMKSFWYYPLQEIENGRKHYKKLKKYLTKEEYHKWSGELLNNQILTYTQYPPL